MVSILATFCLTVLCFGPRSIHGQNVTVSSQQVVIAASANFDRLKAETSSKLNALLTVIKAAQGMVTDTGMEVGNKLTNEYYLEGMQALQGTADFIRSIDFFVATTTETVLRNLSQQGNDFYKTCIAKNTDISSLDKAFTDVSQRITRIIAVDVSYKVAIASCIIVKPELALDCVANGLANNPLPLVNETVINGLNLIQGNAKCIEETAARIKNIGQLATDSVRKVYPTAYLFMVPQKFDVIEGRVLGQPSVITIPTEKLNQAKRSLQEARQALQEAWNAKNINLDTAKAYLSDLFKVANNFVENVTVQPEAAICKIAAKDANIVNQNIRGLALLDCVNNIEAAPTPDALSNLDLSLIDRETRENAASSTVKCFKNLRNVFYPDELHSCMAEAQDDYRVFLDSVVLKGDVFARKAGYVKALIQQCKSTATIDALKQFDADISAYEKCLKLYTKITATSNLSNPYLTVPEILTRS